MSDQPVDPSAGPSVDPSRGAATDPFAEPPVGSPSGHDPGAAPAVVRAVHALEGRAQLDALADPLAAVAADRVGRGGIRWWLGGGPIGHAAHPMLTDLPIGFWTSAFVLDLVGGRAARPAARRLVGLGLLCVPPTALTGASDWSAVDDRRVRRVGLVHAVANSTAALAYLASWRARRRGRHAAGVAWGLVGGTAATVGGHLGGHLTYSLGASVSREPAEPAPPGAGPSAV